MRTKPHPATTMMMTMSNTKPGQSPTSFMSLLVCLMASMPAAVDAGANADCLSAPTWVQKSYKIKDGTSSDLTQCQLDTFKENGVKFQPNNNLIGGDGDASLFDDIYLGGKGEGCQSTENCMKDCQALCCIVPTCNYAVIHRDEDTYCPLGEGTCSVYKEDAYYWYCNLFQGGSQKNTDDDTLCYVESSTAKSSTCASVAQAGMGWNASTYQSLLYLGTNCTTTRRRRTQRTRGSRNLPGSTADAAAEDTIAAEAPTATASTITGATRSLVTGEAEIKAAVRGGLLGIRSMVLPGVRNAIAADGGVKGFATHLGTIAKTLSKGSGTPPGAMGMMRKA
jgi:hypothetical protein